LLASRIFLNIREPMARGKPRATFHGSQSKKLPTYGAVKKNDPQDLISPERAAYNVLDRAVERSAQTRLLRQ
jgi:hypothetical protein